jgi:hypothetical protein
VVIRICKSKKDRQHNSQKKQDKITNNNLQNSTQKDKDQATRTPLKIGGLTKVLRKGKQFLFHMWHLSCDFSYKPADKSCLWNVN